MNFTDTNVFTNVFQLVFNVFPAFSLNTNSWIGRYQRFFITVSATRTLKDNDFANDFEKKFQLFVQS